MYCVKIVLIQINVNTIRGTEVVAHDEDCAGDPVSI